VSLPSTRPRSRPRSLTASASRLDIPETQFSRRLGLPWQRRALEYITLVPELNFASLFYAKMLRKVKLYPGLMDDNEKVTRIESGPPVEILSRIRDPGGGRAAIQASYGRLQFTTGEGILWGRYLDTPEEEWSFVWNDELQVIYGADNKASEYQWRPSPRDQWTTFYADRQPKAVGYRMWTPSPAMSGEATSPMQGALQVAEELVLLTAAVRSTAVSRLLNGMLILPTELSPNPVAPEGDEDPMNNPFLQDLVTHIAAQIDNPGTAEAAAPFVTEGAYDYIDGIKWMALHDPQTDYMERELRKEAIQRLGYGLDMPPEVFSGIGASNHWAGQQVLNDQWTSHGYAVASQFATDLSKIYLRPALREEGYADWERVVIMVDGSAVTLPSDRTQDADQAFDRGAISREGYRRLKNIPEDMASSEADIDEWRAIKLRDPMLLGTGDTAAPDPAMIPPAPGPEGDSGRRTRVVASAGSELIGAASLAVTRCRELAGLRAKQREKNCPECIRMANGAPNAHVAAVLGEVQMARLKLDPLEAVRGGADSLRHFLVDAGMPAERVETLADLVEVFAARTLFDQRQVSLPEEIAEQFQREEMMA
jgi:hypothetical protein